MRAVPDTPATADIRGGVAAESAAAIENTTADTINKKIDFAG
jgi:hypothetical protein